ncbi:2Fe-2S iron-sulfur cluster-binding protein [Bacillus oleivorans]|uniref:2Fe-2S iron-sulfur cluster-binding protein n=1 Tax=Bacillus oleivorans TaxID=1448271 RepID=UPI000BE3B510|nr:2Fe-2S iron-sulfur cluster-binding protein [Bacillus oleivorans]
MFQEAEDQTLLDAFQQVGVNSPYSCKVGRCGTFELKIVEGEAEHTDSFLTDEQKAAQNTILTCVSRAKGKCIKIDL